MISAVSNEVGVDLFGVEIRTVDRKQLVTAIEILSPVNKRRGHRAESDCLRKRADLFRSSAHLVEIDLLCSGERPPLARPVPPAPYYIMLSRVGRRPQVEVWPIQLRDRLPNLPIPLHAPDPDVLLDLGACLATVYERAAYGADIDYREAPPPPALEADEAAWVDLWLREQGAR